MEFCIRINFLICNLLSNERMWVDGNVFDCDENGENRDERKMVSQKLQV